VGPRIRKYTEGVWDSQKFVLRQKGFYSEEIEVERGCTQGDIDSPIIFNLVADAVIRAAKQTEGFGETRMCFYADDGLIENQEPKILQKDLDVIINLFERVGLKTNEIKTKLMVVRGTQAPTARSQGTYNEMVRGKKGPDWRKEKSACPKCGKVMLNVSLKRHMTTIHREEKVTYRCREVGTTGTYLAKVIKGEANACPVPGCEGGGRDKFSFYQHFAWRHNGATIRIEGDGELPRCGMCGMHVKNVPRHQNTKICKRLRA